MSRMWKVPACALLACCIGLAAMPSAFAGTALAESAFEEVAAFELQRAQIERDLADGETYSEITPEDRVAVHAALGRIGESLEASGSVEGMSERVRTQLFNDQELVNNLLTQAGEDSRVVCERRTKTGSNRKVSVCMTVAERRRLRDEAQDTFNTSIRAAGELRGGVGP